MTYADPVSDDDIQYREVLVGQLRWVSFGETRPEIISVVMARPKELELELEERHWYPYRQPLIPVANRIFARKRKGKPRGKPPTKRAAQPTPNHDTWLLKPPVPRPPPIDPHKVEVPTYLYNPYDPSRINLAYTYKDFRSDSQYIAYVPAERGAQIIKRLRAMGMSRIAVGIWTKPAGRLREIRFFCLPHYPGTLKIQAIVAR